MSSSSLKASLLSVQGAKYSRRSIDETDSSGKFSTEKSSIPLTPDYAGGLLAGSPSQSNFKRQFSFQHTPAAANDKGKLSASKTDNSTKMQFEKYWQQPGNVPPNEDLVIIHVCDENQQISKDFCCKRDILVKHMKYFEKFLAENENGYDDIDISVHCDVEIFEWLMTYIHEPENPPKIEKAIIVSILISSEFLQMDDLVELCVQHVAANLNDIIKLPIDLSCISEKLINRIAFITHPKTLAETRDRKDKILTKLYKRRVELDFSRKGSASRTLPPNHNQSQAAMNRTIAASLTCCCFCGSVYLENYVAYLTCRSSVPSIDFRGQLARRHSSIPGWSLTSYLKKLHSGGMGWDSIYWHVWAACIVFRVENIVINALEADRYTVEEDGLFIRGSILKDIDSSSQDGDSGADTTKSSSFLPPKVPPVFSLSLEDDFRGGSQDLQMYKLLVNRNYHFGHYATNPTITASLDPNRMPEELTEEIFELIRSQSKYINGTAHKQLILNTMNSMVEQAPSTEPSRELNFEEALWGSKISRNDAASGDAEEGERRRGRSPGRVMRASSLEPGRKQTQSLSKVRGGVQNKIENAVDSGDHDSDTDDSGQKNSKGERRYRSSSTGNRNSLPNKTQLGDSASKGKLVRRSHSFHPRMGQTFSDPAVNKQINILKSIPPDIQQFCRTTSGPVLGLWLIPHPLQVLSRAHREVLQTVEDTVNLSDHKRVEWELDILREHDEKRMECFEKFLISKRSTLHEAVTPGRRATAMKVANNKSGTWGSGGKQGSAGSSYWAVAAGKGFPGQQGEYYKDKGRQPFQR